MTDRELLKSKSVRPQQATVWLSPTAKRRYLTRSAAISAEARAIIKRKHPTEQTEYDDIGRITYRGFHWTSLPRSEVLFRRVRMLVESEAARAAAEIGKEMK